MYIIYVCIYVCIYAVYPSAKHDASLEKFEMHRIGLVII